MCYILRRVKSEDKSHLETRFRTLNMLLFYRIDELYKMIKEDFLDDTEYAVALERDTSRAGIADTMMRSKTAESTFITVESQKELGVNDI